MSIERGKVLLKWAEDRRRGTKKGKLKTFVETLLGGLGVMLLSMFIFLDGFLQNFEFFMPFWWPGFLIFIICSLILILYAWLFRPSTWNRLPRIYENGLSDGFTPFLHFSEINKVGFGKKKNGSRFIQTFSKKKHWKESPALEETEFEGNNYDKAVKIIKQKCSDIPWEEMEWLEWKK